MSLAPRRWYPSQPWTRDVCRERWAWAERHEADGRIEVVLVLDVALVCLLLSLASHLLLLLITLINI